MNKNDQMRVAVEHIKRVCPDPIGQGVMAVFAQDGILHNDTPEEKPVKQHIIFWLTLDRSEGGHYCAVVIESTGEAAQQRAWMMDRHLRDWRQASVSVQARVSHTRTPIVLAMDGI